jgi:hypothetical protein
VKPIIHLGLAAAALVLTLQASPASAKWCPNPDNPKRNIYCPDIVGFGDRDPVKLPPVRTSIPVRGGPQQPIHLGSRGFRK